MSKPGYFHIKMGLAWIGFGMAVTALVYFLAPKFTLFTLGLILVGLLQSAIGLAQNLAYRMKSPEDKARHRAKIELRALVRAMVAMATADGTLDDKEISMIVGIYRDLIGHPLERSLVVKISETMQVPHFSIHDDLGLTQAEISESMKETIIEACYLVMVADGAIDETEKHRISEVAMTLKIPVERAVKLVESLREKDQTRRA